MSTLGQKRTSARFDHVRYAPKSGQTQKRSVCPLSANRVISRRTTAPLFGRFVGACASLRRDAGGLDDRGPAPDLAFGEFLQVCGRAAVVGDHRVTQFPQTLLHLRHRHRRDGGVAELVRDRCGRRLRQVKRVPGIDLEIGQALGVRRRRFGSTGRPPLAKTAIALTVRLSICGIAVAASAQK